MPRRSVARYGPKGGDGVRVQHGGRRGTAQRGPENGAEHSPSRLDINVNR